MKMQKTVSQRLARAGDGPWSGDLEMGEGSRSEQRRAYIGTAVSGCPASTRAIAAVNVVHVHMCSCWANRPLPLTRCNGAFRRHTEQEYLSMHICFHACFSAHASVYARSRARSSTRRNGTVENAFSVVWFLRVGTVHQYICYKLPNAHGVHANLAHVRGSHSLQSQSLS